MILCAGYLLISQWQRFLYYQWPFHRFFNQWDETVLRFRDRLWRLPPRTGPTRQEYHFQTVGTYLDILTAASGLALAFLFTGASSGLVAALILGFSALLLLTLPFTVLPPLRHLLVTVAHRFDLYHSDLLIKAADRVNHIEYLLKLFPPLNYYLTAATHLARFGLHAGVILCAAAIYHLSLSRPEVLLLTAVMTLLLHLPRLLPFSLTAAAVFSLLAVPGLINIGGGIPPVWAGTLLFIGWFLPQSGVLLLLHISRLPLRLTFS